LSKSAEMIGAKRRILISRTPDVVRGDGVLSCDLLTAIRELS